MSLDTSASVQKLLDRTTYSYGRVLWCVKLPRASGGKSSRPSLNGASRSLEGLAMPLVWVGATECDEFKMLFLIVQRCCMVNYCSTPWSSTTVTTAAHLKRSNKPDTAHFFLCPSLSPARTFLFPLARFVFFQPPFLCRGVVFRSPPATRGRPRWPT